MTTLFVLDTCIRLIHASLRMRRMSRIVLRRLFPLLNCFALSFLTQHFLPLGNSRSIDPLFNPSSFMLSAMEDINSPHHGLLKINHMHFESIQEIFKLESSFYHRVLSSSEEFSQINTLQAWLMNAAVLGLRV